MLPDLITTVPLIVSVLGALGVAGLVTQWYASAKDRRVARANVLTALAAVETARWTAGGGEYEEMRSLVTEVRALETALLIARLPRLALTSYGPLCVANLSHSQIQYSSYGGNPEELSINPKLTYAARYAAETISRIAWSGFITRRVRFWWRKWRLATLLSNIDDGSSEALLLDSARFRLNT